MRDAPSAKTILHWYDRHARAMPWRIGPAERKQKVRPDPYRVWLSEVMLQQTTVAAVESYFLRFTEKWPKITDLAAAANADVMAEWAGLGYYARARNLLKCARTVVDQHHGSFPSDREALLKLPGIGPYTASAITAIAFDQKATVVDGNVERVMARIYAVETPLPGAKSILKQHAEHLTPSARPGDYAQAVMDLGATICTPRTPTCDLCPWHNQCEARALGIEVTLPRKASKQTKPVRLGIAYIAQRTDGAWLLETRPDKGLLGGMLGWPGTDWTESDPASAPPIDARWYDVGTEVRHTFTHFHLRLRVLLARVDQSEEPIRGTFLDPAKFRREDLPTVMRKAYDLASREGRLIEPSAFQPL